MFTNTAKFLSTPSARRATNTSFLFHICKNNFYPRPPRGGRHQPSAADLHGVYISIHALREEGDLAVVGQTPALGRFLSTPSARRATCLFKAVPAVCQHFYPRPPRGGRRLFSYLCAGGGTISIHALREEGDAAICSTAPRFTISIHALREEGDPHRLRLSFRPQNFYPRPPRGGRQPQLASHAFGRNISIHALREEGDP